MVTPQSVALIASFVAAGSALLTVWVKSAFDKSARQEQYAVEAKREEQRFRHEQQKMALEHWANRRFERHQQFATVADDWLSDLRRLTELSQPSGAADEAPVLLSRQSEHSRAVRKALIDLELVSDGPASTFAGEIAETLTPLSASCMLLIHVASDDPGLADFQSSLLMTISGLDNEMREYARTAREEIGTLFGFRDEPPVWADSPFELGQDPSSRCEHRSLKGLLRRARLGGNPA